MHKYTGRVRQQGTSRREARRRGRSWRSGSKDSRSQGKDSGRPGVGGKESGRKGVRGQGVREAGLFRLRRILTVLPRLSATRSMDFKTAGTFRLPRPFTPSTILDMHSAPLIVRPVELVAPVVTTKTLLGDHAQESEREVVYLPFNKEACHGRRLIPTVWKSCCTLIHIIRPSTWMVVENFGVKAHRLSSKQPQSDYIFWVARPESVQF